MRYFWRSLRKLRFVSHHSRPRRPLRGCRTRLKGCLLWVLLLGGVATLGYLILRNTGTAEAITSDTRPLSVHLLIDNSNSMFDLNGYGSDPGLLRIDAARLFISYLGVDDPYAQHRCSIFFFGGEVVSVIDRALLRQTAERQAIFAAIQQPTRLGWTDQLGVLSQAENRLNNDIDQEWEPVIILLTDGKPQLEQLGAVDDSYIAQLQQLSKRLRGASVPLYIILLANEVTDQDEEITQIWRPLWQEMTTENGGFYEARTAEDLPHIYHDIVVSLSGGEPAPPLIQVELDGRTYRESVPVSTDLARLTFVISKDEPDVQVAIFDSYGNRLTTSLPEVRYAGGAQAAEEIWVIDNPSAGEWFIELQGLGEVTVWGDLFERENEKRNGVEIATSTPITILPTPTEHPTLTPQTVVMLPATSATPHPTFSPTATTILFSTPTAETSQVLSTATPTIPSPNYWLWASGLTVLVSGSAGVGYWQQWQKRPLVAGTLYQPSTGQFWELDEWQKTGLRIGGGEDVDLLIPQTTHAFQIKISPTTAEIMLQADTEQVMSHNNNLLDPGTAVPLQDMDLITLDGVCLRYENLRLRPELVF